jgi:alpha-glucosidase
MARGVDGIRIDCAHFLIKDPQMRDNPLNPEMEILGHRPLGEYDSQMHLYDKGHEDIHPLYRRLRALLDSYEPDRTSIGEIHIFDWAQWAAYYGTELDELHMSFNFGLLGVPWDPVSVRALIEKVYSELPDGGWPNWVIGNHDEPRIASRLGPESARMALVLALTLRGTPTIYYGDELGFTDAPLSPKGTLDPWGLQDPSLSRDPQRAPMAWDSTDHGGFCPPGVEPWAPLPLEFERLSVAAQLEEEDSFLGLSRRAVELRRSNASLRRGSLRFTDAPEGCLAFVRTAGSKNVGVILNFSDEPVRLSTEGVSLLLRSSKPARRGQISDGSVIEGHEACIFEGRQTLEW